LVIGVSIPLLINGGGKFSLDGILHKYFNLK